MFIQVHQERHGHEKGARRFSDLFPHERGNQPEIWFIVRQKSKYEIFSLHDVRFNHILCT